MCLGRSGPLARLTQTACRRSNRHLPPPWPDRRSCTPGSCRIAALQGIRKMAPGVRRARPDLMPPKVRNPHHRRLPHLVCAPIPMVPAAASSLFDCRDLSGAGRYRTRRPAGSRASSGDTWVPHHHTCGPTNESCDDMAGICDGWANGACPMKPFIIWL